MRLVLSLLIFIPSIVLAAGTEPPAQPTGVPLKVEIPRDLPTEQVGLPSGASLQIGSTRTIRGIEFHFSYSPDGKFIAAGTLARVVRVWEVETGKVVHTFGPFARSGLSTQVISKSVFSPDGTTLAVASGFSVHLFDLKTGKEVGKLQGHTHILEDLIFSHDGKRIVTGSFDHTVALWDRQTFKRLHSFAGFGHAIYTVAISADGGLVAAGDQQGKIRLYKTEDGTFVREFAGLKSAPSGLRFTKVDQTLLCVGHDEGLLEWSVGTGEVKRRLPEIKGVAVLSPDGAMLATIKEYSSQESVTLWDLKSGKAISKVAGERSGIRSFEIAHDNRGLATFGTDGILRFWNLPKGEEVNPPVGHQDRITAVAFTRDGKTIISASEDRTVRFWDAATGRELKRLSTKDEHVHAMAVSSDGKNLAIASSAMPRRWRWQLDAEKQSANFRFWDLGAGKEIRGFNIAGEVPGWIRFTADGREIMALGFQEVRFIDVKTGKDHAPIARAEQGFPAADVSPNGRYLATSSNIPALRQIGKIAYFDRIDNKEAFSKTFYLGGYSGLAFAPDGKHLAVAGSRGHRDKNKGSPLQLWEVPGDNVIRNFDLPEGTPHQLTFSHDGRMLAAVDGGRVSIFEVATGKLRLSIEGHEGVISSIAFSRDSRQLVTGGDDSRVFVWELSGMPGKGAPAKIEARDLDTLWNDLASADAAAGNKALWRLANRPQDSLPYLKLRLTVLKDEDLARIEKLVVQLDDEQFRIRDRAAKDLEKIGEAAIPIVHKALTHKSVEVREAAGRLLKKIGDGEDPVTSPEARRMTRSIEALERIADPDSRTLLKELQNRGSKLIQHREATAALQRLGAE